MTGEQALLQTKVALAAQGIADAGLEAEVLLMHVWGVGRAQLYCQLQQPLSSENSARLWQLVERRLQREPLAYIVGHQEFFGLDFYLDHQAFIPRPESELLVEEALKFARSCPSPCLIADVGTGSGAIAVALAVYLPQAKIYAIDISAAALEVASINCRKHGVTSRVWLLQGNMLGPFPEPVDLIVANLPYIKDSELNQLSPEITRFEPKIAWAGGADGLDKLRQLLAQSREKLRSSSLLLLEIGQGEGGAAILLAQDYFPCSRIELIPDLSGIDRVMSITVAPALAVA